MSVVGRRHCRRSNNRRTPVYGEWVSLAAKQLSLDMNRPSYNGKFIFFDPYSDQLLVGIIQDIFNNFVSAVPGDPIVDRPLPWCGKAVQQAEPNQWGAKERCVMVNYFVSFETTLFSIIVSSQMHSVIMT